ncbi:hypothetical protein HK098_006254 [Nowakowskiella sp. JEL0407]|nr:hypothetical protein HK098_006254 [Nowakowskiella sp. JEL0407]
MSGEDFEENVRFYDRRNEYLLMRNSQVKEQLNFRSIIEDGPVLSVEYLVVSLDDEESDKTTQLVRENFMEKLVWLITSSPKEPNLKTGIFKDFVEMRSAKNLSYAVWRISEFFPTKTFALDLAVHQLCLNTILRLFNITLDAVCAILSHQDLSSLAWPSREHPISTKITTPIPLDWNTQINLSQKAFYIERYKVDDLPPYPHSDGADSETLVRAYDYWIESLMEMCQQPSVWATTESFESLSLEVRRTCKAFTSNVDESLRFPIHKILESLSSTLCTCLAAHLSSIPELENSPYFIQHSESATDAVRDAFTVEILRLEQSLNELKSRKKRKVLYDRDISLKRNKLENEITEYEDIGSGEEVVYEEEFSPILPLQNGYREEYNDETDAFDGIEMDENMDDVISYVSDDNEIDMTYYSTSSENVKNLAKELRSLINSAKKDLEVDILEN